MLNGRKKMKITLILLFVLISWIIFRSAFTSINPSSLIVQNVMIEHDSITLDIINGNSGVRINKFYQYKIENRKLFLKIYGTVFPSFALTDDQIHIDRTTSTDIDSIIIVGQPNSLAVWQGE